ncbi:microtubule-associated tumor suppressor candidate 2 homolog isoform X2 [Brienomyrus brachyistius]|uniref:microtubule-associated tumor suppressor candidate 2 homolog isoform X2 n=1 Tax=Brienomyrus brachyistius TaxID=42636 RepID=UPI0020B22D64|nr:microtubule-associated tumor suppressor candidate 2 homolog isoform X2 [Brienomyrus brachyistius]
MSLQGNFSGPFASEAQDNEGGETKNNNKPACFVAQGDANANAIQVAVTGHVGTPPPLVSQSDGQDKIDSWEMESPVDDPDLEEFELLECQELEAFLEAEMEHHEKADEAMPVRELLSGQNIVECNSASAEIMSDGQNDAHEEDKATSGGGRSISHFHSGNDALVSRLSASISGESTGRAPATDSQVTSVRLNWAAQPIRTTSAKFGSLQRPSKSVVFCGMSMVQSSSNNLNRNSSTLSQEPSQDAPLEQASHGLKRGSAEQDSGTLINGAGKCQQKRLDTKERKHLQQQNTQEKIYKSGNGVSSDPTTSERVQLSQQLLNRTSCTETDKGLFAGRSVVEGRSLHLISESLERSSHKTNQTVAEKPEQNTSHQGISRHTEPKTVQKQHSGDHEQSASPSSLENMTSLTPRSCDSPTSAMSHSTPRTIGSPKKRLLSSPSKGASSRISHPDLDNDQQLLISGLKAPSKVCVSSGIPKPILHHPSKIMEKTELENSNERSPPPKPKNVRPKIITYIRKSPQVKPHGLEAPYEVSPLPTRLSPYSSPPSTRDTKALVDPRTSPVLSASNLLYDKYRQEMQKTSLFPTGLMVSGIRPPSHNIHPKLTGKPEGFCGDLPQVSHGVGKQKDIAASQFSCHEAAGAFRAPRALRPQLGLGAVNRIPSMKSRMLLAGQKSALVVSQPVQAVTPISHAYQDPAGEKIILICSTPSKSDLKKPTPAPAPKSFLPKPGQSGLRPPGYSRLAPARLAAFSFVRSASISSTSSNQSNDSTRSDPCRPVNRSSCGNEDPQPSPKAAPAPNEAPRAPSRSSPQPPSTPIPARRSLLPASRSSPVASRKEIQSEGEAPRPTVSSPKRFAVVSPRPQSPVHARQKPGTARAPVASDPPRPGPVGGQDTEAAAAAVKQLRERCQEQARRLLRLQAELRKATSCLEAFAISTQHFCLKSNQATQKEKELCLELERIRDEVASSTSRWERLQKDKEALERSFERELQVLQTQQEAELGALEAGLRAQHMEEKEHLRFQHQAQLEELQNQQQDKIQDMTMNHEVAMEEMENSHNSAVVALRGENEAALIELRMTHEHQRKAMEENFEQIRLSLQDQVDTLTFQNRTLRDRAKRFEEALRRSTDEQIVDALAPYQHIEEDLKSLKDVLEMKNQQIHEQEKKICELEKLAQKNIFLEERVQVLQQQNEDLKARIDNNLALSRQLSEENANLQEHVEKESKEKKRLSRNNEELLWRLQTGELSPRTLSPSSSPAHRGSPGATSPSWPQPLPR